MVPKFYRRIWSLRMNLPKVKHVLIWSLGFDSRNHAPSATMCLFNLGPNANVWTVTYSTTSQRGPTSEVLRADVQSRWQTICAVENWLEWSQDVLYFTYCHRKSFKSWYVFCQDGNSVEGQRHSQQVIMYSITKWNTEILSEWPHTETD